jgi:hypothetical protein
MTADQYLLAVIQNYKVITGPGSPSDQVGQALAPLTKEWAGQCFSGVSYSGSYAKDTAITLASDLDLFISLVSNCNGTLRELYESLYSFLNQKRLNPRRQNVSIRIVYDAAKVDLVPGRRQDNYSSDHSLYRRKADTWTKTNVEKHVSVVAGSGRLNEIRASKVWRDLHRLEFPSLYLELMVIRALQGRAAGQLATNCWTALEYFRDHITSARIEDPANSNNILSDDLTDGEKRAVAMVAKDSLSKQQWEHIIW